MRPRKFKTPKEMQEAIDLYFEACDQENKPYTIVGLANTLEVDRNTILNYEKTPGYEKFFRTVKIAKMKCLQYAEEQLMQGRNPAGVIFNLKNNYGYKDKSEIDTNISGDTNITVKFVDGDSTTE